MFLKKVYNYNRWLFLAICLFITAQLFVILIWGIVITPFYNYGMFSEVMHVEKSYSVFEVELNGKLLRGQDFSSEQWDKIILPLQYYTEINKSNDLYRTDVKRILGKMHISAQDENFLSICDYSDFKNWYADYLLQVTYQPVHSLKLYKRNYKFTKTLLPTDSVTMLTQICH
ncbi:MAG TPA: hypothetical protein VF623_00550 [Segetibacter sp.]